MSDDPKDHIDSGSQSDCCQAPVMSGGLCSACKEHCESEPINDEPNYDAPTAKEEQGRNNQIFRDLK